MRRALAALAVAAAALPLLAADPPLVDGVSGAPVAWSDLVAKKGPVAVLAWASWAPTAGEVLDRRRELAEATRERGLQFVVLVVQEPLEDARQALAGTGLTWVHDRHGALLKSYRVIELPSIVVVSRAGEVVGRLEPTAEAVRGWRTQ